MKNAEKEKLAQNMIISILLTIAYAVGAYVIYNGFMNNIHNDSNKIFVNFFWVALVAIGLVLAIVSKTKKNMTMFRYSISVIFYGLMIKLMEYGLLVSPIPNLGKYLFFGLEALAGIYIVFITISTLVKIRR